MPTFNTDEEAEHFVETADLSEYDLTGFKIVRFEFERMAQLDMRLPESLLEAIRDRATARGIPYERFVLEVLEQAVR